MRRRLFNIATAVSLLLCMGIFILWLATEFTFIRVVSVGDGHVATGYSAFVGGGRVSFQSARGLKTIQLGSDPNGPQMAGAIAPVLPYEIAGVHFGRWTDVAYTNDGRPLPQVYGCHSELWLSLFWPFALTAILPAIAFPRFTRYMRKRMLRNPGLCAKCSYDLTANTSGVCPECGTPVQQKAGAVA
jgi:hypothetical protein